MLFAHEAHGFVAELKSVVDGFDAGARGVERSRFARGVDCDTIAGARGFADCGGEFFFGVLVWRGEFSVGDRVGTCFVNLDEVGAFFQLFADHGDEFGGVVRVCGVGEDVLLGVVADGVLVAAENIDGVAADAQAGAGNFAAIDGVAHGGVCRAGAFGAHVALSRESGHQIGARGESGHDGALRDGFCDCLQVFLAGMEEEVDVRVDEAGEKSGLAEVDYFRCGRTRDFRADFFYGVALDQDFAGGDDAAEFYVEQPRGMEDDRVRSWRGLRWR